MIKNCNPEILTLLATVDTCMLYTVMLCYFAHMHRSQCFCHFKNASWKSCSVRVFSTACDSASITSTVSKWQYLQTSKQRKFSESQVRQVEWVSDKSYVVLGQKFPGKKGSVRCCISVMQQPDLLSPKFGRSFRTFSCSRQRASQ
jgi:hypothetical protein